MQLLRENVNLSEINSTTLTNDCKFVKRVSGQIDLVKCTSSSKVFDHYWDLGIHLAAIWQAGGSRNPKFEEPEF